MQPSSQIGLPELGSQGVAQQNPGIDYIKPPGFHFIASRLRWKPRHTHHSIFTLVQFQVSFLLLTLSLPCPLTHNLFQGVVS